MKIILLATGALLVASAVPAMAQDTSPAPAATSAASPGDGPSFTGPRAEIFGGWDRVGTRTRFNDGVTRSTDRTHTDGFTMGGLVGYDMPVGSRYVAGVYGSYAISTAKDCSSAGGVSGCLRSGREIEGGARFGAKVGDKTLAYVKGAYVNGQVRGTSSDGLDYITGHANRDGWRAGAGVEYALNKHTYMKVEYDYTRFKSFDAADLGVADTSLRYDQNQVLGGFGIRF